MRVFITGASGHIASAVIPELLSHGHSVVGLARSDASAATVQAAGAEVLRGDLGDLDLLRDAATESDGVIHLAFRHDIAFSGDFAGAITSDIAAINAIGDGLADSQKPFLNASGSLMIASPKASRPGVETDGPSGPNPRGASENAMLALADRGVRTAAVRLAPMVHSELDRHGFVAILIGFARENGFSAYVGEGTNVWPGANTHDVASLYRLGLEKAPAGSRLHAVESEGYPFKAIAQAIADQLGIEAASVTPEEANEKLGFLAGFSTLDNPTSNTWTRETLGWEPTHRTLLEDIADGHYFAA